MPSDVKINIDVFKNDLFYVGGVNNFKCSISYVDIKDDSDDYNYINCSSLISSVDTPSFSIDLCNKDFNLDRLTINVNNNVNHIDYNYVIDSFNRIIYKEFLDRVIKLGLKHREKIKDIVSLNIDDKDLSYLEHRINSISNLVAHNGRVEHSNWIILNNYTYSKMYNKQIKLNFKIDNNLESFAVFGIKNDNFNLGVNCAILTDNDGFVKFYKEPVDSKYGNISKISIYYKLIEIGSNSQYQYFTSDIYSLKYSRLIKLDKLRTIFKN